MPRLPPNLVPYYRTREYDESTIPTALALCHTVTKPGVWARVRILEGSVGYMTLEDEPSSYTLDPQRDGIIPPGVPHKLVIEQPVRFHLEFLRPARHSQVADA